MGKRKRIPISLGTVFMLLLTIVVIISSALLLDRMSGGTLENLDAKELISAMTHSLEATDAPSSTPSPQSTIKTTAVTMAPVQDQTQASAETQAPALSTFTLTVGGQLGFHSDVSDSVYDASTGTFDYAAVLQDVVYSVYSDVNIFTFPHLLTVENDQYADVSAVPDVLDAARILGADYLLLNHAHVLDKGEDGLSITKQQIEQAGVLWSGVNNIDAQGQARHITVNGVKIAVLGYADTVSTKTKENVTDAASLAILDAEKIASDIETARKQGADFVLVSLYWGAQDATAITEGQRDIARLLSIAGADMIIGAGTDAVLPVEWVDTVDAKGNVQRTLVAYSMGSLLTEKRDSRSQVSGALLHVRVSVAAGADDVTFESVAYTPTYIWKQEVDGSVMFRVLPSSTTPPAGMNQRQSEIMGRALQLIDEVMATGPAVRREQ